MKQRASMVYPPRARRESRDVVATCLSNLAVRRGSWVGLREVFDGLFAQLSTSPTVVVAPNGECMDEADGGGTVNNRRRRKR